MTWSHVQMGKDEEERFDLSTSTGLTRAREVIQQHWGTVVWSLPAVRLGKLVYDKLIRDSDVSPEKQAEAASKIIEAGRMHGAKRIRFTVDKDAGGIIKANAKGVDVKGGIGVNGKMELEVEYK